MGLFKSNLRLSSLFVLLLASGVVSASQYENDQVVFGESGWQTGKDCHTETLASNPEEIWESIRPSKSLVWHRCYGTLQCARLLVPLDYSGSDEGEAVIALTRVPSPFPRRTKFYKGPILFNPGGPGGSGVALIVAGGFGKAVATMLGGHFDIVGFDPRGIGRSIPTGRIFNTSAEGAIWSHELNQLDEHVESIPRSWARAQLIGRFAAEQLGDKLKHIQTDYTARDMLSIVEAYGEKKLKYWGYSYGTVLGAVFAAMFPDKVERLILDGVVDSENYFTSMWSNNLVDAHKAMQSFYDGCANAGPEGCPFYAETPELVAKNLSAIYSSLQKQPIPVVTSRSYGIFDYVQLRGLIFSILYSPVSFFYPLALALRDLARGNATLAWQLAETPTFNCNCQDEPSYIPTFIDGFPFVACTDGKLFPETLDFAKQMHDRLRKESEFGGLWANIPIMCSGWKRYEKKHFQGPFEANTSFPILWIGNTADPVTPLINAHKMAEGFPGSVVLTQNSAGHCSVSTPSVCTITHIRNYFINGVLPPPETTCEPSVSPWPRRRDQLADSELSEDEQDLLHLARDMSRNFKVPRLL